MARVTSSSPNPGDQQEFPPLDEHTAASPAASLPEGRVEGVGDDGQPAPDPDGQPPAVSSHVTVVLPRPPVPPAPQPAPAPAAAPQPAPAAAPQPAPAAAPQPAPAATDEPAFWIPGEGTDGSLPRGLWGGLARRTGQNPTSTPNRAHRQPHRPAFGLPAMVLLALLAAFFAWVSAEPLLLAAGQGTVGEITVARCTGSGLAKRCVGDFRPADGSLRYRVAVMGLATGQSHAEARVPARVVGRHVDRAYAGDALGLHLRWAAGAALLLLCAAGIAWVSGATRLADRRSRRWAVLTSLGAPILMLVGFVAAAAS